MPFADFQPSQAAAQTQRRIFEGADFAVSLMERATKHSALLQDIEQKKEKFVTDQLLDSGRLEEQALRITEMKNQQDFEAKTREHRLVAAEADGDRSRAEIAMGKFESVQMSKLSKALPNYLYVLEQANSYDEVESAMIDAQATFGGLATSKAHGPQAKAFLDRITATATAMAAPFKLRARKAAFDLGSELDATPEGLAKMAEHPNFEIAMQDPEFKKTVFEARKEHRASQLKIAEQAAKDEGARKTAEAKAAGAKGQPMHASLFESTEKLRSSYEALKDIKNTYDTDKSIKGPFIGLMRELDPWDIDATLLAKKVTAAVPGLARGVFGEVGVLTEADMATYKSLLPGNRTPEAAAKVLFEFLSAKVSKAYEQRMIALKGQGFSTKGFPDAVAPAKPPAADAAAARRIANGL